MKWEFVHETFSTGWRLQVSKSVLPVIVWAIVIIALIFILRASYIRLGCSSWAGRFISELSRLGKWMRICPSNHPFFFPDSWGWNWTRKWSEFYQKYTFIVKLLSQSLTLGLIFFITPWLPSLCLSFSIRNMRMLFFHSFFLSPTTGFSCIYSWDIINTTPWQFMTPSHLDPHLLWVTVSPSPHHSSADVEKLAQKNYIMFLRSHSVSRDSWGNKCPLFWVHI